MTSAGHEPIGQSGSPDRPDLPLQLRFASIVVATLALLSGASAAAAERDAAALVNACAACHGPDGRSKGAIPTIAGMPAADFVDRMRGFRDGTRAATLMHWIAKGLSATEIEALAAYLAEMKARP